MDPEEYKTTIYYKDGTKSVYEGYYIYSMDWEGTTLLATEQVNRYPEEFTIGMFGVSHIIYEECGLMTIYHNPNKERYILSNGAEGRVEVGIV